MEVDDGSKKVELEIYACAINKKTPSDINLFLREVMDIPTDECRYLIMSMDTIQSDALQSLQDEEFHHALSLYFNIKFITDLLDGKITEVNIFDIVDNYFLANLIINQQEMGMSAPDGVIIATLSQAPVFTNEKLLSEYGHIMKDGEFVWLRTMASQEKTPIQPVEPTSDLEKLEKELNKAIKNEDYETAAKLRDQIEKLKNNPEK